jgi:hypothetical protein
VLIGVVVTLSANRTEDRGFESRQGVSFLELDMYIAIMFFVT